MTAENIISFVIYLLTASIMFGIGITQLRSRKPVGFYSGEQPPKEESLTNVTAWNKKHGTMWLIYGFTILLSYGVGTLIGDSVWCIFPMCGGLIVPVIIMVWYHHQLMKKYLKSI